MRTERASREDLLDLLHAAVDGVNPHVSHFFVAKRRRVLSGLDESVKRR